MPGEAIYATKATPHSATKLFASDVGHLHAPIHKKRSSSKPNQKTNLKKSLQVGTEKAAEGESLEDSALSAEDSDADDNDENGADADEGSSDAEDPDVIAPSGCAVDDEGHQTGPAMTYAGTHTSPKRLKQCLEAEKQQESSDDEGYEGVNLVSDSEKDGSEMDYLEERAIVESEDTNEPSGQPSGMAKDEPQTTEAPWYTSFDGGWEGVGVSHPFDEPPDFFHEQISQMGQFNFVNSIDSDGSDSFTGSASNFENANDESLDLPISPAQRRVHFAEPPHSEISGFSLYNDAPISMFDALPDSSVMDSNVEAGSDSSSGYESDYGETTDEDDVPASATARPQALIRRSPTLRTDPSSPGTSTILSQSTSQRKGPRMASWCVDPTKPLAFVDSCGTRILVCPARRPKTPDRVFEHLLGSGSTSTNASPRMPLSRLATAPTESEFDQSDFSSQGVVSPMFGPPNAMETVLLGNNFAATTAACPEYSEDMALYADMGYDDYVDDEDGITMEDLFNISSEDDDSEVEPQDIDSNFSDSNDMVTTAQSSRNVLDHLDGNPLKRKASPPLHEATRRKIMA